MGEIGGERSRLTWWRRRYLLRHYKDFDDRTLAAGAGVSPPRVAEFLGRMGATRSTGNLKRIAGAGTVPPPELWTPELARRAMTRLDSRPLAPLDRVLVAAMFVASLLLYGLTCARTVTGEDAGELLAAAHQFGVPHPPGYPLWLLLSWGADHAMPWLTTAWRVAMVSGLSAAGANALLLTVALKTVRSRTAALTAAALFAVSLTHWTQSVIPEVYALNTFFVALQILQLIHFAERPTAGRLLALAAVTGLSCTNHTSAFPVGGVVALAALAIAPHLFRSPKVVLGALFAGLLPLAIFLVLIPAARHGASVDWGHPATLETLWKHAVRDQYSSVEAGQRAASEGATGYLRRLSIMAEVAGRQFGSSWVLLLAALGLLPLFVRQTGLWLYLVAMGWVCSVAIVMYTAFPFEREFIYAVQVFWIPTWLVVAWFIAGGIEMVIFALQRLPHASRMAGTALALIGCVALVAYPASAHYARADRSRTTLIAGFGQSILDVMEPGALYFPASDHSTFSVLFQQGVLDHRTDVTIADKYGRIEPEFLARFMDKEDESRRADVPPGKRRAFEEALLIRKWPGPIYFANRREMDDVPDRRLEPVGPIYKVMTKSEVQAWWTAPMGDGAPLGLAVWEPLLPLLEVDDRQQLDLTVQMVRGDLLAMRGVALLAAGRRDDALAAWSRIGGDLAPLKQSFNNIGAALAEHGDTGAAIAFFAKARQEDPRYVLALRNEALVRRNRGERPAAIDLLRQALDRQPKDRVLRLELAHLLEDEGKLIESLAEYEALASTDDQDPIPWRDAGRLLERNGDLAKAQNAYAESLRLKPGQDDIRERLQRMEAGAAEDAPIADRAMDNTGEPGESAVGPPLPRLPTEPSAISFDATEIRRSRP